jgi:adenylyltransferase/sulfurtransferase
MENDWKRYHCQMALPGFGKKAQQLLQKARVLIVGTGGLGCPASQYLAAVGIGTIGIADDDVVSRTNLHRQILFTPEDVGLKKVTTACKRLQKQNPSIKIQPFDERITSENVMEFVSNYDVVVEGTDNFETKYLLNDACVLSGIPLIYGAIYQYEGHAAVWNVQNKNGSFSPNYRDLFPDAETAQVPDCSEGGVIPTLAGITGCMQANEAIKYITRDENLLAGKLWMMNAQTGKTRTINLDKTTHTKITALPGTIPTITIDEIQNSGNQSDYELLDVRTAEEHQEFNIGGKNIPMNKLGDQLDVHSFSNPLVCYCASGKHSVKAARMINKKHPESEVYSLKNGVAQLKNREF